LFIFIWGFTFIIISRNYQLFNSYTKQKPGQILFPRKFVVDGILNI